MTLQIVAYVLLALAVVVLSVEHVRRSRLGRRLLEERRMTEYLEEVDRLRGDLIATITHQLKTPLTSLLGYATLLRTRGPSLSEEQRDEYITVIERQSAKIMKLIEELLTSARVEKGAGMDRSELDLAGMVRSIAEEFSNARDREIEVNAPPGDLGLFGDRQAIEHVLGNLLDNALKYSAPDTHVEVMIWEDEGEVLTSVRDFGVGIAIDELPHVFERFRQASARTRGSAGLGLYIVRNLVNAHGGKVWAESDVGKGTTVTFSLPRRRR